MQDTVSVSEAARALGISPDAVRKRLSRGTLQGVKGNDVWRITLPRGVDATTDGVQDAGVDAVQDTASSTTDALQAVISKQDSEIAFLRARLEASAATIDELIGDLRNERQRVDVLEAGRLRMLQATNAETDTPQSPLSNETGATLISTRDAPPAPRTSILQRLLAVFRHDG